MGHRKEASRPIGAWMAAGVIILIILLFVWLTIADMLGSTDIG